ncbi:tetratricopeptide repeat protein [Knoellia sp. Soil729]|uniref:tetratricopeptide repeat protein n=1 Tax=Knoellia sp. Soil729 TaxID=1736394 RepID=UPI0006FEC139|nr:tetratricopeptide repeat protein [Knoellia sp. Soil729]KRE41396.1 Mur ligase [Knoellia sp. Soil729]
MTSDPRLAPAVTATEVRVLEGPNLYFPKPAVKVTLDLRAYLEADRETVARIARSAGLGSVQAGAPCTEQRQRVLARLAERAVRQVSRASGTSRLGIRSRPGGDLSVVVVSFVWRRRGPAQALGESVAPVLAAWLEDRDVIEEQAAVVRAAPEGPPPRIVSPRIPVASVTGTNGKTSTTRLLAHIAMTSGKHTAWSSTDGVVDHGTMIEPGDYSGPAGARGVLGAPGVEIGILETARGGMLLKGLGVSHNDVSVVTNVTADHLGLQGVDTVDQLAEVKAIITRATRPGGWTVLNGDDPRVWAMRTGSPAKPWVFSLDANSPAIREALGLGGRAITVLDDHVTVLTGSGVPDRLVSVVDVPMTISGLSRHNVANVLAATAAALALGIHRESVIEGLRTFRPDAALNPGRMNTYTVPAGLGGTCTVIVDLAHNEAGLEALMDVAEGLREPGSRIHLGLGAGGDRTDEILENLGEIAGHRADHVVAAHKEHYLRGRTMEDLEAHLRVGLQRAGVADVASFPTEMDGLRALVAEAHGGDVVAIMCHSEREAIYAWLAEVGGVADSPPDIRRKVIAARGEHEAEDAIAELWVDEDAQRRIQTAATLSAAYPGDARIAYEYGGTFDSAGQPERAVELYRQALGGGLREPFRHRAVIQLASSLRNLGQHEEAVELLDELAVERPESIGVAGFRALALQSAGRADEAVATLLAAVAQGSLDEDVMRYRRSLTAYAADLAPTHLAPKGS